MERIQSPAFLRRGFFCKLFYFTNNYLHSDKRNPRLVKKLLVLITLFCLFLPAVAQVQPFGEVDTADLKLTSCEFEKDAKAELLFDHCIARLFDNQLTIERHVRLKIFDLSGNNELGNVSIIEPNDWHIRAMSGLRAETINLVNGKIEIIPVDKNSLYKKKVNEWASRTTIVFPGVKNGSILEYSYKETSYEVDFIPGWYFQSDLPIRYSEYDIKNYNKRPFRHRFYSIENPLTNSDSVVAMANVPSLSREPFMDTYHGNLQRVMFPIGNEKDVSAAWESISTGYMMNDGQLLQLKEKLKNEQILISAVKNMAPRQKLAWLFKKVRDTLSVDEGDNLYDNISKAWTVGKCSREQINIILCRLLEQAGLDANLVIVSGDKDERINPNDPSYRNLDETLVHVKIDDDIYVLDASDKDAKWNEMPFYLLNTYGLYLNVNKSSWAVVYLEDKNKARDAIFVDAEILPDGKMTGTAQLTSSGYNRTRALKKYKDDGERKFCDSLRQNNNYLKIASFKIDNMETDTLPLVQHIDFSYDSPEADGNYLYISPKLFSSFESNPFINADRVSNIDFGYRNNTTLNGRYKIPRGYKVDALPKSISMLMPDSSIRFRQIASEADGFVNVRWVVDYNKSYFTKDEYPSLYDFFRKMYEILNGQIVLKKN